MYRLLLALGCVYLASAGVWAQDDEVGRFRGEVERLNERYEDFFSREEAEERYYRKLSEAIPEIKAERQRMRTEAEEAAIQYRKERRPRPDTSELEREWEAEKLAQEAIHDGHRKRYVESRSELKRISESARKIPENRDAGLE